MREPKLVAVSSSDIIANEIREITESFLGRVLPITTCTTAEVREARPDVFYLCAVTQRAALARVVPPKQMFVFELHPTTLFFLAIARIPDGETVCVFNNRLSYTGVLTEECRALGIRGLRFLPVAYEEMPADEVRQRLRQARYIVGVDRMVQEGGVLFERYRAELGPEVRIIPGKRTASIASASRLLSGLAAFYGEALAQEKHRLEETAASTGTEAIRALSKEAASIFDWLKNAALQLVTSQIGSQDFLPADTLAPEDMVSGPAAEAGERLQGQMDALRYLEKKLRQLSV